MTFRNYKIAKMTCENNIAAQQQSHGTLSEEDPKESLSPFLKLSEFQSYTVSDTKNLRKELHVHSVELTLQPASGKFSEVVHFSSTTIQKS